MGRIRVCRIVCGQFRRGDDFAGQFRVGFRFDDGAGFDPVICIWAATAGNWLGGMTTYGLGRLGKTDWLSKYFKISPGRLEQIRGFAAGRGAVAAFFGFLPAVGDVIVFVPGLFKANLTVVAFSMFVGKFLRYCLLAYGVLQGIEWLGAR